MWLEAILTEVDLQTILQQFSPLTIRLGDTGSLSLAEPTGLVLIPDEGIGVVCDATLHWPVLGFDVPVALRGLTVRILPLVDSTAEGSPLVFRLQIDHTGVAMLPSMVDHHVTARVNEELQKKHVELSWNFLKTLTREFALPAAIESAAAISLVATAGTVKANNRALGLAVRFETAVRGRPHLVEGEPATAPPAAEDEAADGETSARFEQAASRPAPEPFDARAFVIGGAVSAMAFVALGALGRLLRR